MWKKLLVIMAFLAIGAMATPSRGAVFTLFEHHFNVNGVVGTSHPNINVAGFDLNTGLGTITGSFSGTGSNYFGIYVDHEIDEAINGFSNEVGSPNGAPVAGQTWEIDEPGFDVVPGDIYTNSVAGTLDNMVGFASPNDVAMAMAWQFNLLAGETAHFTIRVSTNPPPSGFYLAQFDPASDASVYLSGSYVVGTNVVPEPSALVIVSLLGATLVARNRFRKK